MKILHTVAPGEFGGLEEVVIRLCGGLRSKGHEVTVACVQDNASSAPTFVEALQRENVEVQPLNIPARHYLSEIRQVRELCKRLRPDVTHTHGYRACVLHSNAVRPLGVPLVMTLHGFTGGGFKNRLFEALQLRAARSFDAVICVSEPMAIQLKSKGMPGGRLHVIQNSWKARYAFESPQVARRLLEVAPGSFHVGWVGRLSHEKGPDRLLEALALLPDRDTVTVSIIGDGPLAAKLSGQVETGEGPLIRFHGSIPNAGRLLPGFDVFVLSSRTEGTPIVLFEAMAAGVPIVATDVGGVPYVLGRETALLVEGGEARALAEAIHQVRADRPAAETRAERARGLLDQRFSVTPWLEKHEALYESVRDPDRCQ